MKKRWQFVPLVALAVGALCVMFDMYISDRGRLDLTANLFGLDFGIRRGSTDSYFYWFWEGHSIPLDAILYSAALITVGFAFIFSVLRVSNTKKFVGLVSVTLLVGIMAIHIYFRYHLDGVYDDLGGDWQWEFKDGQIVMVTEKGRDHLGAYTRAGGKWACSRLKGLGGEFHMEPPLLGVWWAEPQMQRGGTFMPRRCFSPIGASLYNWYIRI